MRIRNAQFKLLGKYKETTAQGSFFCDACNKFVDIHTSFYYVYGYLLLDVKKITKQFMVCELCGNANNYIKD